jgi:hypothetical protein
MSLTTFTSMPAREVAALGGQQAMYQLRHVLTGFATGGAVGPSAGLLSTVAGLRAPGLSRLDLGDRGRATIEGGYHMHFHERVKDQDPLHITMLAHQRLLHDLSNR